VDRFGRTEQQHHPAQGVFDQAQCNPDEGDHAFIVPQRSTLSQPTEHAAADGSFAEDRCGAGEWPAMAGEQRDRRARLKGLFFTPLAVQKDFSATAS
jgi:hypothetical protein